MTVLCFSDLVSGFIQMGIKPGDTVLVHSSLSSFGFVEGGADTVIDAFIESVGPEGTIMVPTLTGRITDSKENPPVFDVRTTPCWTGRIPETFRKRPAARRSLHPTHSIAAIGGRQNELTSGHETTQSPCDRKSPFHKNALINGRILLIGVDQETNTTIHCCEELAGVDYHLQQEFTDMTLTGYDGEQIQITNQLHNWHKPPTDFNHFDHLYAEQGIMKTFQIGNSTIRLIDAKSMVEYSVDRLLQKPHFLLK